MVAFTPPRPRQYLRCMLREHAANPHHGVVVADWVFRDNCHPRSSDAGSR